LIFTELVKKSKLSDTEARVSLCRRCSFYLRGSRNGFV